MLLEGSETNRSEDCMIYRAAVASGKPITIAVEPDITQKPTHVYLTRNGTALANFDFDAMQDLRRGVAQRLGGEHKIHFVKAIRAITRLGLLEAKCIADWLVANAMLDA